MAQNIQTEATNLLSGIPFGQLIGAPLTAAVDAQNLAAMETVKFIEAVGFKNEKGNTEPATVTFSYKKSVPAAPAAGGAGAGAPAVGGAAGGAIQNEEQEFSVTVPLLTIVPIPYLRISSMTINFNANIQADTSTSVTQAEQTKLTASLEANANFLFGSAKLNASVSNTSSSNTTSNSAYNVQYTMGINVVAQADAMPAGMQAMLNILTNMISAAQPPKAAAPAGG